MKHLVLIFLAALTLIVAIALSPSAQWVGPLSVAVTNAQNSPLSPLPSPSDSRPSDEPDAVSSNFVWVPQVSGREIWIKTHQVSVGWWDASGQLHIVLQVDGMAKIPMEDAHMISIPGDAAGVPAPPGWQKQMRPENGEWVIVRIL